MANPETLLFLRHAKSSWDDPALDDFDRPLNARGRDAAARMGAYIIREDLTPDIIVCSSAARTRETHAIMAEALSVGSGEPERAPLPTTLILDALYLAAPRDILRAIDAAPPARRLMVIGHNPGMQDCALTLADKAASAPAALAALAEKFPTGALAIFRRLEGDRTTGGDVGA